VLVELSIGVGGSPPLFTYSPQIRVDDGAAR
jgi:hypothetical protein